MKAVGDLPAEAVIHLLVGGLQAPWVEATQWHPGDQYAVEDYESGGPALRGPSFGCKPEEIAPLHLGGWVRIKTHRDGDLYVLDRTVLERGERLLRTEFNEHWQAARQWRADGITGDAFLQCCLFGHMRHAG